MQALQSGYTTAGTQAQEDLKRALSAGQGFTNLGQEQQQLGTAGLKTMSDYGAQQQVQGQKLLDYPMAQTQQFAKLLQGYQMPMGTTTQSTGPEAGAYSGSPLSQITGLGTLVSSLFPNTGALDAQTAYYNQLTENAKKTGDSKPQVLPAGDSKPVVLPARANGGLMNKAQGGGVRLADGGMAPLGSEYHDGNGNFYDADGYLVG
jgi:hypothetical protein